VIAAASWEEFTSFPEIIALADRLATFARHLGSTRADIARNAREGQLVVDVLRYAFHRFTEGSLDLRDLTFGKARSWLLFFARRCPQLYRQEELLHEAEVADPRNPYDGVDDGLVADKTVEVLRNAGLKDDHRVNALRRMWLPSYGRKEGQTLSGNASYGHLQLLSLHSQEGKVSGTGSY
jgi:hypothetical protein